jgi:hypothetical protein
MSATTMKVRRYISTALIANVYISGFWEFTRTELFRAKIQRFHSEPAKTGFGVIVSNCLAVYCRNIPFSLIDRAKCEETAQASAKT